MKRAWSVTAAGSVLALVVQLRATNGAEQTEPAVPEFRSTNAEVGLQYPLPDEPCVALIDFNQDGYVDLLLGQQLWRNDGRCRFTRAVVLPGKYHSFGDFDNDGDLDIYATSHREKGRDVQFEQWLLRCDGDGKYTNTLEDSGLKRDDKPKSPDVPSPRNRDATKAHGFLDYDNDGDLDLFTAGYETDFKEKPYRALLDHLYKGDGRGHFVEVTAEAGLEVAARPAVGVAFCDFDNDGHVDIYVANYRLQPNFLWHNQGDGTFQDIAVAAGATAAAAYSNGVACADFDHDGDFDIFVANLAHATRDEEEPRSRLLRNEFVPEGKLHFSDVTVELGLDWRPPAGFRAEADWINPVFADFNNDGWPDLFVTESCQGGTNHRDVPLKYGRLDSGYSKMYLSERGRRFIRIDTDRNALRIEDSWGAVAADFDNDGWPDLVVGSHTWRESEDVEWFDPTRQKAVLLRGRGVAGHAGQKPSQTQQYLNVTLTAADRALAGAVVLLTLDNAAQQRALLDTSFSGYSVRSNQLHFGLGAHAVRRIRVSVPGGQEVEFKGTWRNTSLLIDVSAEAQREPQAVAGWQ